MKNKFKEMAKELKTKLDGEVHDEPEKNHIHIQEEDDSFSAKIAEKFSGTKETPHDFSIIGKIKNFSSNAVHMVAELDEHLADTNSPYEVGDFKVSANIGIAAGMSLDIRFKKTPGGKIVPQKKNHLSIVNPKTGKKFSVAKKSLGGKKRAKVKDPESGETFVIDTKTGRIITS